MAAVTCLLIRMRPLGKTVVYDYEINPLVLLLNKMKMFEYITSFQFLWYVIFMNTESKRPIKQGVCG